MAAEAALAMLEVAAISKETNDALCHLNDWNDQKDIFKVTAAAFTHLFKYDSRYSASESRASASFASI